MKFCGTILFLIGWTGWIHVSSQPAAGYYNNVLNLSGKELQQALHDLTGNHRIVPYDSLYHCFTRTDVRNDSIVWDMYSDKPGQEPAYRYIYGKGWECGNYNSEADCYNREHSFPKSWFRDLPPMNSDLFHIYPTDGYVNNRRANYPFGETVAPSWISSNGSKVGPCSRPGYTGVVFEPVDEYKGDFARTCFYMAVRYFGEDASWPGSDMVTGSQPRKWAVEMLLAWHRNDPVSTKEINRNNEVCRFQGNRNPFIDDPGFVEKIWGIYNLLGDHSIEKPFVRVYPNPATNHVFLKLGRWNTPVMEAEIYTASGIPVAPFRMVDGEARIDLSNFSSGIFFFRIFGQDGCYSGSFVKFAL